MPHSFQLEVLGIGNAYDGERTSASLLLEENDFRLLLDCGPTVPAAIFHRNMDPDAIDAIYITHTHPDHCLGLSCLLNWMDAKKRKRPLLLIAQAEQWPVLEPLLAFSHWPEPTLGFVIERQNSESLLAIGPWQIETSVTRHAVANLSLQLRTSWGHRLFYSGDGSLSHKGQQLAAQSNWVFLECETLSPHPSHGCWLDIQKLTHKPGSQWRLYHIDPQYRPQLSALVRHIAHLDLAEEGQQLVSEKSGVIDVA
ncbi:MBL fold metallo-hydrolase [Agarivorans sp. QJM3NY_29]|uniref:MBL fold metallo-hydrolase n=1 Tax=unclassified Agarivorans TaxID=2636026 RepID=UPI003D7DB275